MTAGAEARVRVGGGERRTLTDGTRVLLRPLRPGDRACLRAGLECLSGQTRFLRFHGHGPRPTEAELDYLLDLDGADRAAWGALDLRLGRGAGVARYVRLRDEPGAAEVAVTVVDAYQRRGLGRLLLARLAGTARAAGIERFRAAVLAENGAALTLAAGLGATAAAEAPGLLRLDAPVAGVLALGGS